jgi:hypothetical protein
MANKIMFDIYNVNFFLLQVRALPLTGDIVTPYYEFIQNYGTHFISEVYMGAKAIHESEFTSASYQVSTLQNFFHCH